MSKTNAVRILEAAGVAHIAHEYDVADGEVSGIAVSEKIHQEAERVFKTLVTEGKTTGLNVFVIPSNVELDLKKAALEAGDKYVEMLKLAELEPKTGYVHGGCSPIGMKKQFPTFIDETAQLYETIFVSGGRTGLQVELAADDLVNLIGGKYSDLF